MEKIIKWIHKNIFWIALYLGVISLLFRILFLFGIRFRGDLGLLPRFINFNNVGLSFLDSSAFYLKIYTSEHSWFGTDYLSLIYMVLLIVGAFLYRYRASKRLLIFSLCIPFICSVESIVTRLIDLFIVDGRLITFRRFYWPQLKAIIVCWVCYIILKKLLSQLEYRSNEKEVVVGYPGFKLRRATWSARLSHFLTDSFLVILIFSDWIYRPFSRIILTTSEEYLGDFAEPMIFIFFSSLYYLFFEGILKTTPGKILTNSHIVALDGKPIGFSRILGRTLLRRIPFNALSFLGDVGWHDRFSTTTIAKLKAEEKKNVLLYRILLIVILCIFSYSIYAHLTRW